VLIGAMALLYCVYFADQAGNAAWLAVWRPYVNVGQMLGSHAAVVLGGAVLTVFLRHYRQERRPAHTFTMGALAYAAGLGAAGLLLHTLHALHPAFCVNKVLATAPWCLISSSLTCVAWIAGFALIDLAGWRRWPKAVSIAGENALMAYLMAPFLLSVFALSASLSGAVNLYEVLGRNTFLGFTRSAIFAWIVVRLCGWMRSRGIRMQL
jgi:predicted acyltransferase